MKLHSNLRPATRLLRACALVVLCLVCASGCKTIDALAFRVVSDLLGQLREQAREEDYPIRLCAWPPEIHGTEHLPPLVTREKCQLDIHRGLENALFEVRARPEHRNRIDVIPLWQAKASDAFVARMMVENWDSSELHDQGVSPPTMAIMSHVWFDANHVDIAAGIYRIKRWQPVATCRYRGQIQAREVRKLERMKDPREATPRPGFPFGLELSHSVQSLLRIGDSELERKDADPQRARKAVRKALKFYQDARRDVGDHPAVVLRIAYLHAFEESLLDPEMALRLYLSVANSDKCGVTDRVKAMVNLAVLHERQGRSPEAEEWLTKASEFDEDNPHVLLNRGCLARKRGEHVKGERFLQQAVAVSRSSAPQLLGYALGKWGVALYETGKTSQAVDVLLEAATDPSNLYAQDASYNLAIVHLKEGQAEVAAKRLLKLQESAPDDYKVLIALGVAYANAQHQDEAQRWLEKAMRCKPMAPESYLRLAWLHYNKANYIRAEVMLEGYRQRLLPGQELSADAKELGKLLAARRDSSP